LAVLFQFFVLLFCKSKQMRYFVYVVTGKQNYIDELNLSLQFLRCFSRYPIVVVTDSLRNEGDIHHDNIFDIKTPDNLSNVQAHLYLETSLLLYLKLEEDDLCCYLDSDVIAINESINDVFDCYVPPIMFAKDHCTIDYFSAGVMHCKCAQNFELVKKQYDIMTSFFPKYDIQNTDTVESRHKLKNLFLRLKKNPFAYNLLALRYFWNRYVSTSDTFWLNKNFYFNKKDKCWYNQSNKLIDFDYPHYKKRLWKEHGIRHVNNLWQNKNGQALVPKSKHCSHLRDYIKSNYSITIPENWAHWNAGVFLFGKQSEAFMQKWHIYTMNEIQKGHIKPYDDQATLSVCAWEFGISNRKRLPVKFNFITDLGNNNVKYDAEKGYTYNNFETVFDPAFLHVYHHWGNKRWSIWRSVEILAKKLNIRLK